MGGAPGVPPGMGKGKGEPVPPPGMGNGDGVPVPGTGKGRGVCAAAEPANPAIAVSAAATREARKNVRSDIG